MSDAIKTSALTALKRIRHRADTGGRRMETAQEACDEIMRLADDALSTPTSSPVSGEGERIGFEPADDIAHASAMDAWRKSLKRPDLSEEDRVRGALMAYERSVLAATILDRPPEPAASGETGASPVAKELRDGANALRKLAGELPGAISILPLLAPALDHMQAVAGFQEQQMTNARPPEGNARGLREALIEVNALIVRVIRRHESMETVDIRRLVERALALPVDDEAKRIRAEVIVQTYENAAKVADDYARRMTDAAVELGAKGSPHAIQDAAADAGVVIANVIRALAQPEQGGAT